MRAASVFIALLIGVAFTSGFAGGGTSFYKDAFSNNTGGWWQGNNSNDSAQVMKGAYLVRLLKPQRIVVAAPTKIFGTDEVSPHNRLQNTTTRVDMAGRGPVSAGVFCRGNSDVTHAFGYWFGIVQVPSKANPSRVETWAKIYLVDGGFPPKKTLAARKTSGLSDRSIKQIEASCKGDTLSLKIDGRQFLSAHDSTHRTGANGVFAANLTSKPTEAAAAFDNYVLSR